MKNTFNISEERYLKALQKQIGSGLTGFRGVRRQRGGGFGSILFNLAKYAIPVFEKYVLPHAKEAVKNIVKDVQEGKSIKTAVKSNAIKGLKEVGKSLIKSTLQQEGEGLTSRRTKLKRKKPTSTITSKPSKRCCTSKPKNKKQKTLKDFGFQPIF